MRVYRGIKGYKGVYRVYVWGVLGNCGSIFPNVKHSLPLKVVAVPQIATFPLMANIHIRGGMDFDSALCIPKTNRDVPTTFEFSISYYSPATSE